MFGAFVPASASQSPNAPEPPTNVIVTKPPGATLVVLTVSVGGGSIVKDKTFDVPPPGAGVCTAICVVPLDARSLVAIDARSCVALENVVGRAAPFHCTTDEATNPLPLTVSVSGPPPAAVWVGKSDEATGAGFSEPVTVTVGLVAARLYEDARNNRNS